MNTIADKDQKLAEAIAAQENAKVILENKEREIRMIAESNKRSAMLEELLAPLNQDKRTVMANLLESVQTSRLKGAFEKYLPAVLAEGTAKADKQVIAESRSEVTGDKTAKVVQDDNTFDKSNVIDLKRLAGL
jgi:hypothetical protein